VVSQVVVKKSENSFNEDQVGALDVYTRLLSHTGVEVVVREHNVFSVNKFVESVIDQVPVHCIGVVKVVVSHVLEFLGPKCVIKKVRNLRHLLVKAV